MFHIRSIFSLLFLLQFVNVMNLSCVGKYQIPSDGTNFSIFPRNISMLNCNRFSRIPLKVSLENNGQTIIIRYTYENEIPSIENGPFGDKKYRFEFMYFNWLNDESLVVNDGKKVTVPIELHLVFINTRYGNFERASTKNLGIAIMSYKHVLYEDSFENKLYDTMRTIRNPYEKNEYDQDILALFSSTALSDNYFVYVGKSAITQSATGTCGADVLWLDFPKYISILPDEFQIFRELLSFDGVPLMSKIDMSTPPNTTIYASVDRFDYAEKGWTAETFEGFAIAVDSSADDKNGKWFFIISAIIQATCIQMAIRFIGRK